MRTWASPNTGLGVSYAKRLGEKDSVRAGSLYSHTHHEVPSRRSTRTSGAMA